MPSPRHLRTCHRECISRSWGRSTIQSDGNSLLTNEEQEPCQDQELVKVRGQRGDPDSLGDSIQRKGRDKKNPVFSNPLRPLASGSPGGTTAERRDQAKPLTLHPSSVTHTPTMFSPWARIWGTYKGKVTVWALKKTLCAGSLLKALFSLADLNPHPLLHYSHFTDKKTSSEEVAMIAQKVRNEARILYITLLGSRIQALGGQSQGLIH